MISSPVVLTQLCWSSVVSQVLHTVGFHGLPLSTTVITRNQEVSATHSMDLACMCHWSVGRGSFVHLCPSGVQVGAASCVYPSTALPLKQHSGHAPNGVR